MLNRGATEIVEDTETMRRTRKHNAKVHVELLQKVRLHPSLYPPSSFATSMPVPIVNKARMFQYLVLLRMCARMERDKGRRGM